MIDWVCCNCEDKISRANDDIPGKCTCGGWYVEDDGKRDKTYRQGVLDGYKQASDDLANAVSLLEGVCKLTTKYAEMERER
jgi:hypothetical protein